MKEQNESSENRAKNDPGRAEQTTLLRFAKFIQKAPVETTPTDSPSADTVTSFVVKAAQETCEQSPQPVIAPKTNNALPAQSMLGVVSYCYSKGVVGSAEIERKLHQDPALKAACGENVPDSKTIRRFRRLNREAIQSTLEKILRFRRKRVASSAPSSPLNAPASPASHPATEQPGESTMFFARQEATVRIENAVIIDSESAED